MFALLRVRGARHGRIAHFALSGRAAAAAAAGHRPPNGEGLLGSKSVPAAKPV